MLLLSRLTSSRFMQGAFNAEVLSSEVGATARVVADVSITLFGHLGNDKLLNMTLLPPFLFCISSIVATCWSYNSIYWVLNHGGDICFLLRKLFSSSALSSLLTWVSVGTLYCREVLQNSFHSWFVIVTCTDWSWLFVVPILFTAYF